ncbi:MAG: hypothetical protein JWM11_5696, partial [Planctomycetaceae bacterium]|nr:hypothetical protein [Planctomycetaceae bacterium]
MLQQQTQQQKPLSCVIRFWVSVVCLVLIPFHSVVRSEQPQTPEAKAPPNHVILKHTRGGVFYITKPLKERYDAVRARIMRLNTDLQHDKLTADMAIPQLDQLQEELIQLRKEIEQKKVLVSPLNVHQQEETTLFELGPNKLLVITSDQIQLETWDGPQIKCVLIKNVLAQADEKPDAHFKGLRIVHQHGLAPNIVGRTEAQIAAEEKLYLASPAGQALTKPQQEGRAKLVHEIAGSFADYQRFQGQEIDTLAVEGLLHNEGNRHLTMRTQSSGGDGNLGSDWQRQAQLLVSVPVGCRVVAVRGCLVGVDVHGLKSDLILTNHESKDREYDGQFEVRDLQGRLRVKDVPIQVIEHVRGDVSLTVTEEFANSGTTHSGGLRVSYVPSASKCSIKDIAGNLTAWFARSDLEVAKISGKIDIRNDFGDTKLSLNQTVEDQPHRIVSLGGNIETHFSPDTPKTLQVLALTNHGSVTTDFPQDRLDDTSFSTHDSTTNSRRNWRGMISV